MVTTQVFNLQLFVLSILYFLKILCKYLKYCIFKFSEQVEEKRRRDEECGCEAADLLRGLVDRKLVKKTVMTVAYGVTEYGARHQLEKNLKDLDTDQIPTDKLRLVRDYLQKSIFASLETNVFQGSKLD